MKSIYQEHPVLIQEGLRFVTKILGLEYVLTTITTGTTMKLLSSMLHAIQLMRINEAKVVCRELGYSSNGM